MDKVTITIFKHIIRLQERSGKRLSDSEYAKAIGITRQAFASLMKGETMRMETETIGKLTAFFRREGMPITPNDIFIIEQDTTRK
jgi:transcriptional regulator with XRE-family HTH domain